MGPHVSTAVVSVGQPVAVIALETRAFIVDNFLFGQATGEYAFADDDSFLDRGIIDSTGILELVAFVEERYAVAVTDEELTTANFDSVTRIAQLIHQKQRTP
jgi:acyl carrier protein